MADDLAAVVADIDRPVVLTAHGIDGAGPALTVAIDDPRVVALALHHPSLSGIGVPGLHDMLRVSWEAGLYAAARLVYGEEDTVLLRRLTKDFAAALSQETYWEFLRVAAEWDLDSLLDGVSHIPVLLVALEHEVDWVAGRVAARANLTMAVETNPTINERQGDWFREQLDTILPTVAPSRREDAGMTAREAEVLQFVASGSTNGQIADQLSLSTRTVENHIANIYAKIGVHGRVAAANWAREHGVR